ncbi:Cell wall-associated hydrolase, NlpC family [Butyrivibrio hungatei]|uniref:Cell wall-associated hydrolase, NlpC family n=1 Tax=Butyrivibrio hungatei TaxID=185008 RepID=A0A1G5BE97_9FIRM|nr:C40 family peptidase [Butyrivibrio hungatei]SCX88483.1 Cell wall-associated hydrolase, NlpC family [Butyrivibrio hungatei]
MNFNQDENIGGEALDEGVIAAAEINRELQKQYRRKQIRKSYYRKDPDLPYVKSFADRMQEAAEGVKDAAKETVKQIVKAIREHPVVLLIIVIIFLCLFFLHFLLCGFEVMISSMGDTVLSATYTAYDEDITGVDADYVKLERELQETIDRTEEDFPDYDEYVYNLDEIGHNPYELASYLTVRYEDYKRRQLKSIVKDLFKEQYDLSYDIRIEKRSRTVRADDYSYVGTEYYTVNILTVNLANKSLGAVIAGKGLNEDEKARYEVLLATQGNKSYLFDDVYADYEDPDEYHPVGEALSDQSFAAMIAEGEKYLGRAYVWGGSNPTSGFDCSGFVSWVVNHCGWNLGRQTANGLKNRCSVVSPEEARPGDLIFFKGTYATNGASHVGIYVGDGMMLHCGNPIQYTSINTRYWEKHFYCFGRLP